MEPEDLYQLGRYWYGDCVSLVVFRYDGGTDPIYSQAGVSILPPGTSFRSPSCLCVWGWTGCVQQQMLRQAMQTFDRHMAQGGYYEACSAAAIWQACG